ncbi:MAG TPA: ATP-binding protein [Ilumatobacter sp.]|nr:ATP-binding protein [Ilumatobacter sp.]
MTSRLELVRPAGAGVVGVVLVVAVMSSVSGHVDLSVPALLLLLPILGTSAVAGWRAGAVVAVVAAVGYAFAFVPPVGDVRPRVLRDAYTSLTFTGVAVGCGLLVQWARAKRATSPSRREPLGSPQVQLLSSVGHDLRNPLHTIQAITARVLPTVDAQARSSLETVVNESARLTRIVSNLLSASRLDAGALVPAVAPEYLPTLVSTTVERVRPGVTARLVVDIAPGVPDVAVDAVQFDQVLTNLLENAARYAPPDGAIGITARRRRELVEIIVTDDGCGFAAHELDGPVPFRSGARSSGAGLGLIVCRGIVEAHGGTLRLGASPTGGAAVTFTLPVAR